MSADATTPPSVRRRVPRWLWIGFFVSLAINLVVLDLVIGAAWHFRQSKIYHQAGAPRHFGAFLRRLPQERRKVLQAIFREPRPELDELRQDMRVARRAAADAMRREPFDKDQFAEANRRLYETRAKLRIEKSRIYPRVAETMTVEERRMFLEWRQRHWRRWRKWHRKD